MKEFFNYFFGAGEANEFSNFTLAHFIPLILMGILIFLIFKFKDKIRDFKHEKLIRMTLSFMLIITEMSYFWRLVGIEELNANPIDHLPITVCGWAVIFCSNLVLSKSQSLFDIVYFWLFSGTLISIFIPATVLSTCGPTRFRYYQFWFEHTLGFVALFYMMFVYKMRPTFKSMIKSVSVLAVLGVVAFTANEILGPGANYLFLARPEDTPSILDILPSNMALRILIMAAVILTFFFIAYLPWFIMDKKKAKLEAK